MRIGYVQFRPVFGAVDDNRAAMERLIGTTDADLLVLPELATTGYAFTTGDELAGLAEPFDSSPSLDRLQTLARERSCTLVVGYAERDGDRLYNAAAILAPDGDRHNYRKIHLFGAENRFFTPGDIPFAVHDVGGARLGVMICFDWLYPESARVLALLGAEIICHPVNFVLPWGQKAAVTRSVENRVFIVTANRYGDEVRGEFSFTFTGASQITTPSGEVLIPAPIEGDAVAVTEIDHAVASDKHLNRHNDLLGGRRPEFYGPLLDQ
jgi:predicted amidohydrolase